MKFFRRLTDRGLTGALFRYQLMANIVGVLIIPLFVFTGLHFASGKNSFKAELAIFGVSHGYLYIVYLVTAGFLAFKARLHIPWILLMFAAGLIPGLTFVVEWLVVTRKIHPLLAEQADAVPMPWRRAAGQPAARDRQPSRSITVALACPPPSHMVWKPNLPPVASRWFRSVPISRTPLAPSGCPSAIAPPRGLNRSGS